MNPITFDEAGWLKLVFLLNDTQNWLDEMSRTAMYQLPVSEKRKFRRKTYFLTMQALAHILEKHYYKIQRYPHAAKFTISIVDLLNYIRDAFALPINPVPGTLNFQRIVETDEIIGHDRENNPVKIMTVITDGGGRIVTAFPGLIRDADISAMSKAEESPAYENELLNSNGEGK